MKQWLHVLPVLYRRFTCYGAYERYLLHHASKHPEAEPLTYPEFFKESQHRRWNGGPKRCC